MGKLNAISPSEKLTLMLDGELDPKEELELLKELDSNPALQEEMDQLITIREALVKDTEAFTPPAAVTSSIFSTIGYVAPVSAGSAAAGAAVSSITPLMQSIVLPLLSALLISGGTLIFTSAEYDGIFVSDITSVDEKLLPNDDSDTYTDSSAISDLSNIPVTSSRSGAVSQNQKPESNSTGGYSEVIGNVEETTGIDKPSSGYNNKLDQEEGWNNSSGKVDSKTSSSTRNLLANSSSQEFNEIRKLAENTEQQSMLRTEPVERIRFSRFVNSTNSSNFAATTSASTTSFPDTQLSPYRYTPVRETKTTLSFYSVGAASQIGFDAVVFELMQGLGVGFSVSSIMGIKDEVSNIESSEIQIGPVIEYKVYPLSFDISEDFILVPVLTQDITFGTNLVNAGSTFLMKGELQSFSFGAGYRLNTLISEMGDYQLSADTPLPTGIVINVGIQF